MCLAAISGSPRGSGTLLWPLQWPVHTWTHPPTHTDVHITKDEIRFLQLGLNCVWWCMHCTPLIPALGRWRQTDQKFKVSHDSIAKEKINNKKFTLKPSSSSCSTTNLDSFPNCVSDTPLRKKKTHTPLFLPFWVALFYSEPGSMYLCSTGWPGTHCVEWMKLTAIFLPLPLPRVQGSQAGITMRSPASTLSKSWSDWEAAAESSLL